MASSSTPTSTTEVTRSSASRSRRRVFLYSTPASSAPTTIRRPVMTSLPILVVVGGLALVGPAQHGAGGSRAEGKGEGSGVGCSEAAFGERPGASHPGFQRGRCLRGLVGGVGGGRPRRGQVGAGVVCPSRVSTKRPRA